MWLCLRSYNTLRIIIIIIIIIIAVLEDYRLIVTRRFACPYDLESYSGGSVSSW
jgi:hypothetical protein